MDFVYSIFYNQASEVKLLVVFRGMAFLMIGVSRSFYHQYSKPIRGSQNVLRLSSKRQNFVDKLAPDTHTVVGFYFLPKVNIFNHLCLTILETGVIFHYQMSI